MQDIMTLNHLYEAYLCLKEVGSHVTYEYAPSAGMRLIISIGELANMINCQEDNYIILAEIGGTHGSE